MNHSDDVSIRRVREPDLCQLVRLISETIGISYAGVYPPRAVQFFKDFHSEKEIADRSKTARTRPPPEFSGSTRLAPGPALADALSGSWR
jgi:hypothetical protein